MSNYNNSRTKRVSSQQIDLLWQYLNSHKKIAVAFNRSMQDKEYAKGKWKELAKILNSQREGSKKDWKGWSKYWVDYKAKLKKRFSCFQALQAKASNCGGVLSSEQLLSAQDAKFLSILGHEYGMTDVQESSAANTLKNCENLKIESTAEEPHKQTVGRDPLHAGARDTLLGSGADSSESERHSPSRSGSSDGKSPSPEPGPPSPAERKPKVRRTFAFAVNRRRQRKAHNNYGRMMKRWLDIEEEKLIASKQRNYALNRVADMLWRISNKLDENI